MNKKTDDKELKEFTAEKRRQNMDSVVDKLTAMPDEQFRAEMAAVSETPLYKMLDYAINGAAPKATPLISINDKLTLRQLHAKLGEWMAYYPEIADLPAVGLGQNGKDRHFHPGTAVDIVEEKGRKFVRVEACGVYL